MIGSLLSSACSEPMEENQLPEKNGYVGILSVIEIGDELFEQSGILADYVLDVAASRVDIYLHEVSFSSQMPVKISTVILPGVACTNEDGVLHVYDTDIVPMMEVRGERVPYDRYLCTDIRGTVTAGAISLTMKLGGFRTDYRGVAAE